MEYDLQIVNLLQQININLLVLRRTMEEANSLVLLQKISSDQMRYALDEMRLNGIPVRTQESHSPS